MTKRMTWLSVAVMVLAMVFSACDSQDDGDVSIADKKPPQVAAVTVAKTENNLYYIVTCDALAADLSYELVFQQNGKNTIHNLSDDNGNTIRAFGFSSKYKYDTATGAQLPNDDFNKLSARVSKDDIFGIPANRTTFSFQTPGEYRFGVRTWFQNDDDDVDSVGSDVKWADVTTLAPGPKVDPVNVTQTADRNYVIISWTTAMGATAKDTYKVYIGRPKGETAIVDGQNIEQYAPADGNATPLGLNSTHWSYRMDWDAYEGAGIYYFGVAIDEDFLDVGTVTSTTWSADTLSVVAPQPHN